MYKILTLQRHVSPKISLIRLLFAFQIAFALLLSPLSYAQESYSFVTKWGSQGAGDGQFNSPQGIAIDSNGNVYVADGGNFRIQKFTSNGQFITKWGSFLAQFNDLGGIAVDSSGNVYVTDASAFPGSNNHRIQKFTADGQFITEWGSRGSGNGQFQSPTGITIDSNKNIYVIDYNNRIQKFTADGQFITKWGSQGEGDGQFQSPSKIAIDSNGNVYVADGGNNRIQKFTANGQFITKWGSYGSGDGQFDFPQGIAVDSSGNVYVSDSVNQRIQKFTADGQFITKWGSQGTGDGQFNYPAEITVDSGGNVYVANNNRIQKFAPTSTTPNTARLINLSANAKLPIIGGLGMSGTGNLRLMFRGFAIESCVDPVLVLQKYPSGEEIARNDNWQSGGSVSANISDLPSHLTLTNPKDAGLLIDLPVGYYTISLGSNGCNGQGLIGVDLIESASSSTAKLINLSANAPVPIIGGLGMSGSGNMQAMFRGFKVDACIDPNLLLQKYPSGENFASNDNWETDNNVTQVRALPSHLQLPTTVDSGLLRNLTPQYFTATLSTQSGCQGNGLFGLDIVQ